MSSTGNACAPPAPAQGLHAAFLGILPRVEQHACVYFRALKCPHHKEEAVAETVALAWMWFVRLAERGKDATQYASALATYAVRAAAAGKRVCGQEKARDVLSPVAQRRHGFAVEPLAALPRASHQRLYSAPHGQEEQDAYEERLSDNTRTPPDEQAAFRIDWRQWLLTRPDRDRRLIHDMAMGARTKELARQYGVTQGRISQKRREFHDDWAKFCGEPPVGEGAGVRC